MALAVTKTRSNAFSGLFAGYAKNIEKYRLYRQTVKELSNLSDRELNDLNISRWDIERIARESVNA